MKRIGVYFFSILLGLVLIQVIFLVLQGMQSQSSERLIRTLLRQEISSSNNFLVSRTLSDLHESRLIKCVKLVDIESNKTFLDLSYKDSCSGHPIFLNGENVVSQMTSLNGSVWEIHFQSVNGSFFNISLWLSRVLLSLAIAMSILVYRSREQKLSKELAKKVALKELADQAAHDVVSPLSLLNSIVASELVAGDAKDYLKLIRDRVQDIVQGLKDQSKMIESEQILPFDIVDVYPFLISVIDEKKVGYPNIQFEMSGGSTKCYCNRSEVQRVFSNILNNAIEASKSGSKILVKLSSTQSQLSVSIEDFGIGIPEDKISQLGSRGTSYGKENGSGLGLSHAITSMKAWGGDLRISSREGLGTHVCMTFQK
jgi:signal transduction histidine kinase